MALCGQYATVPLDRRSALFRAQPVGEALAQLRELGRDDREAIGAALSFAVPIGLVMILGGIPVRGRLDRGDDRGRPVRLVARDGRARGILLRGVQREDGAAVLGADVVPLPVALRRIVGREPDVRSEER